MLNRNNAIVVVAVLLLFVQTGVIDLSELAVGSWLSKTAKIDRVTYVYEKDETIVPPGVQAALRELNKSGIVATPFEDNSTTGLDKIPDQDTVAVEAARAVGLPCLVVQAGAKVVKIVRNPTTDIHVLEAVK